MKRSPLLSVKKSDSPRLNRLLSKIREEITPKQKEREKIKEIAREVKQKVTACLQSYPFINIEYHGSYVKGTWLSQETDLDLFTILQKRIPIKQVKKILKKIEEGAPYHFQRRYAEHPYLRTEIKNVGIDIVPSYQAGKKGEKLTPVDRTPKHTEWVKNQLSDVEKDEVRLLKKFLKGIGTYGAEIRVGGFSGMACEVLIEETNSFYALLQYLKQQKEIFLDPTNSWEKSSAFKYFNTELVAIDPTDYERNLLAALGPPQFALTKIAAECFLETPTRKFFYPNTPTMKENKIKTQLNERAILIVRLLLQNEIPPDTFWGQAKKAENDLRKMFLRSNFTFFASEAWNTKHEVDIAIELGNLVKPSHSLTIGPPAYVDTKDLKKFLRKYRKKVGPWIGYSGKLVAQEKLAPKETRAKTRIIQKLDELKLHPSFKDYKVLEHPKKIFEHIMAIRKKESLVKFLTRKLPWLY